MEINKTITQMSADLAAKRYSSVELTQYFLDRIKKYDPQLNAFISVTEERALSDAAAADARRATGTATTLTGIPIAQKDIFCTSGIKTSCGSKMLDNFIAPYDATVVTKFADAGAVLLGKTNMDEFAMGSSNENSYYGPVKNPWDLERVPGGSSGGSAAAVCARLAPIATGTDTGGSIRQPSGLCGITGLKPTYGRVSRYGMIAYASSLDQGGPMAASAEDCAHVMNDLAGHDPKDSTSIDKPTPDYTAQLTDDLTGLKVGIIKDCFSEDLDSEIADRTMQSAKLLESLGAELVDVSIPSLMSAIPAYYVIAPAECSSNLARYDGVRYGYRCDNPQSIDDMYKRTRHDGFGKEVKRRIIVGTYTLSAGYFDAYYLKAQKVRRLIQEDFVKAFQVADILLCPTSPTTAFKLGEKVNDPISMYLADIYTIAVNLAGLPAITFPVGFVNNLPIGSQLIGNYFSEKQLLNVVHRYQLETDFHTQCPPLFKE